MSKNCIAWQTCKESLYARNTSRGTVITKDARRTFKKHLYSHFHVKCRTWGLGGCTYEVLWILTLFCYSCSHCCVFKRFLLSTHVTEGWGWVSLALLNNRFQEVLHYKCNWRTVGVWADLIQKRLRAVCRIRVWDQTRCWGRLWTDKFVF
jgi:hypothetical protein